MLDRGQFTPFHTIQEPSTRLWPRTTDLLEEEGDLIRNTLIADATGMLNVHCAVARSAFTADDHPMNPAEVKLHWAQ
jgi:hypothetical protein